MAIGRNPGAPKNQLKYTEIGKKVKRPARGFDGLLLDADNTLLDFDRAERAALRQTLGSHLGRRQLAGMLEAFHCINAGLWRQFEAGRIGQAHLRLERFRLLVDELHLDSDPAVLAARYIESLKRQRFLRPHAVTVLRALRGPSPPRARRAGGTPDARDNPRLRSVRRGRIALVLVSNGIAAVQRARLARIEHFFEQTLISEEVGFAKPDRRIFDLAIERLGLPRERVLCVGDSPGSDIRGGHNAGLATCWYAYPPRAYPDDEPEPDYRIEDLRQLLRIVQR